jgi:hypothetical protein
VIPELDLVRVRKWVESRNADLLGRARGQLEYQLEVSDRAITLLECRPPWDADRQDGEWSRHPVARFRYTASRCHWTLYWRDRNHKFHVYDLAAPSAHITELIDEVEADRTGIFWG